MTLSIMTLSTMIFSIMTLSIMTLSIMTLSIMTLSIKAFIISTINMTLSKIALNAEFCYAELSGDYAQCHIFYCSAESPHTGDS
jgi:hypothetical protein